MDDLNADFVVTILEIILYYIVVKVKPRLSLNDDNVAIYQFASIVGITLWAIRLYTIQDQFRENKLYYKNANFFLAFGNLAFFLMLYNTLPDIDDDDDDHNHNE